MVYFADTSLLSACNWHSSTLRLYSTFHKLLMHYVLFSFHDCWSLRAVRSFKTTLLGQSTFSLFTFIANAQVSHWLPQQYRTRPTTVLTAPAQLMDMNNFCCLTIHRISRAYGPSRQSEWFRLFHSSPQQKWIKLFGWYLYNYDTTTM